jgi:hypothetical protein
MTDVATPEHDTAEGPIDWESQLSEVFRARFPDIAQAEDAAAEEAPAEAEDAPLAPEEQAERVIGTEPRVEPPADPEELTEDPDAALPSVLRVPIPGSEQEFDLDVDTAQRILGIAAWAENLPQQTREQFAAIETGVAVAIPRSDYERFRAWEQANAGTPEYDDDLDPRVAQRIAELEQRVRQYEVAPAVQQSNARADYAMHAFSSTAERYADEHGLTPEDMGYIFNYAVNSQVIPNIAESMRTYSPTGQLVRDADYHEVARRAFDFALVQHPDLRQRAFAPATPSGSSEPDPTAIKKARAGSLSSAPSAAVTTPPRDPRTMTDSERREAMAAELRAAMSGG